MDLDNLFDADSDNNDPWERRIKFTGESKAFLKDMEARGFPLSNLVNFIVWQATPAYKKKGYTMDGYDRMKQTIRSLY